MPIRMEESVDISRPVEEVVAYMRQVENDANWQKSVVEAKFTSEGPTAVGSTGVHRVKFMGMTDDYAWELTEFDEARQVSWRFTSGPLRGTGGYGFDSTAEGTKVTWRAEVEPQGFRRLLAPLVGPMFAKEARKDLQSLKSILESQSEAPAS